MRFSKKGASKPAALTMTSMLDVIFLLLCFFVTISVYAQWESEINIRLPKANTAEEPDDRLPGEVVLNISKDGVVRLEGKDRTHEELRIILVRLSTAFPNQSVIIRADVETKYETILKVIDTCRSANVWNFALSTSNAEQEEKDPKK